MKITKLKLENSPGGYTIIETMISVSLFLVIVISGMGALLNANLLHEKSRSLRSVIDNLSFVMEDISRNLRTGYDYHCIDGMGGQSPHSCATGSGVLFKSSGGDVWEYYIDTNATGTYSIFKSVNGGAPAQITPGEVAIDASSQFVVTGAEPPAADLLQPLVTIRLTGTIAYKGVATPFLLQTSVSQRAIDI